MPRLIGKAPLPDWRGRGRRARGSGRLSKVPDRAEADRAVNTIASLFAET